jgi:hypothetical protein
MDMPNRIIHLRSLRKSPFGPAGLRAGFLLSEFVCPMAESDARGVHDLDSGDACCRDVRQTVWP